MIESGEKYMDTKSELQRQKQNATIAAVNDNILADLCCSVERFLKNCGIQPAQESRFRSRQHWVQTAH